MQVCTSLLTTVHIAWEGELIKVETFDILSRTNAFHHSLFIRFPRIWDSLPVDVKDQMIFGYKPFINALRKHILTPGVSIALPK